MLKYCLLLVGILYLSGCSTIKPQTTETLPTPEPQPVVPTTVPEPIIETPSIEKIRLEKLLAQHQEWKGTRYRMGSHSKSGTDCSGFVLITFREKFGIELPRSTGEQNKLGIDVKKNELITGDLVFFRTGRYNHVGIYLEDGQFLHASTRAGVKISKLSDPYWKTRYWKAKRLDLSQQLSNSEIPAPPN
jgi:cell wall-associated NlpC family hydrolase